MSAVARTSMRVDGKSFPDAALAHKHLIVGKRHPAAAAVPNQLFDRGR
jgi:hypothetical protein